MAGKSLEGTVITDGKGNYKILKGGQWVDHTPKESTTGGGGKKFSPQAQSFLNDLSTQASESAETRRMYERAEGAVNTLRPGPNRGRFLEIATPEEGGGFFDTLGAALVGGPARLIGAITPQDTNAYQSLKALQSENVLGKQILQKGPQTESDAARLQLTEISPSKSGKVNKEIIEAGKRKTDRVRAKAIFYTKFANKYGLNGTSPNGFTADQLWNQAGDIITERYFPSKGKKPQSSIKVLSRRKK